MKNIKLEVELLSMMYRAFGRDAVARMLTVPRAKCEAQARKNKDQVEELIAKRDRAVEAVLDFAEEWANADDD